MNYILKNITSFISLINCVFNITINSIQAQKQPEKKPFRTASSLVVIYTNDFSDLTDKSTSQG